jgi:molybdate transport system substrate-binding protein
VRAALVTAAALAALATGCGEDGEAEGRDGTPELVVSAASSMTEALTACARDFPGATVRLQFAGSDELAAQIRQGVAPDVYAAANTTLPEELHEEGLLSRPVEFATNEFVLAVPSGSDIDTIDDLAREGVKLAIGSESVPIGAYTRETLARLPPARERAILANVRSNEPDVKGIVGKLVQGAADAGFVYVTDVNAAGGELEAVELSAELEPGVTYGAGVVDGTRERRRARAFVDGLVDGTCARALKDAGFGPASG